MGTDTDIPKVSSFSLEKNSNPIYPRNSIVEAKLTQSEPV